MPPDLDWRVGPHGEEPVIGTPAVSATRSPAHGPGPRALVLGGLYLVALGLAAWVGFTIGLWSEGRGAYRQSIGNALDVESLAWRQGDVELYRSTLDPEADPIWLGQQIARFRSRAPWPEELRARSFRRLAPDRVEVEVDVQAPGGTAPASRDYVLKRSTWFHTEPTVPGEASDP